MNNVDILNALNVGLRIGLSWQEIADRLGMSEFKLRAHCTAGYDEVFASGIKALGLNLKAPGTTLRENKKGVATIV